jgi:hypothetical protein
MVERSDKNKQEYDTMKEFFLKLFQKSVEKNCAIKIPVDFVCAPKGNLQDIMAENSGKAPAEVVPEGTEAEKSGNVNNTQGSKASGA